MADTLERRNLESVKIGDIAWQEHENTYQCRVALYPEEDGGFSIFCLNLPGVASQGDDEAEAIENIKEAFRGAVLEYQHQNRDIPWATSEEMKSEAEELGPKAKQRWIEVDVQ
jgi:predicted RNase H-like HicB family nuclease